MQAGVEPANGGFANRSVRPLRHCIVYKHSNMLWHNYWYIFFIILWLESTLIGLFLVLGLLTLDIFEAGLLDHCIIYF